MAGRQVALLRGINVGPHRRISMPELREQLVRSGYADPQTYLQSGNVVLDSPLPADRLARALERLIQERFGHEVPVVVRGAAELAEVVASDPLPGAAEDPKRYQVSFLSAEPDPEVAAGLRQLPVDGERFAILGREIYAWHAAGIQRSRLAQALVGPKLGVVATARNWTTVLNLREMARSDAPIRDRRCVHRRPAGGKRTGRVP